MTSIIRTYSLFAIAPFRQDFLKTNAKKAARFLRHCMGVSAVAGALLYPPLASGKTITIVGNVSPNSPPVGGDWWSPDLTLYIGSHGVGTLILADGATAWWEDGVIGAWSAGDGTLVVDGAGSSWRSELIRIGDDAIGAMRLSNGANAFTQWATLGEQQGSRGSVLVEGADSVWNNLYELEIGLEGTGSIRIVDGGTVLSRDGYVGHKAGSDGTVSVEGAGSKWTNSSAIYLGNSGKGTLTVRTGGNVSNTVGYIGNEAGSRGTVTVTDSASTWSSTGMLYVGVRGTGELTISNGGKVFSKDGAIGRHSTSTGEVAITGTNSTWTNTGNLFVGYDGTGTLTVEEKGIAEVAGTIAITADSSIVLKSGGALRSLSDQANWITGSGAFTLGSGGGVIDTQHHTVTINHTLSGTGGLAKTGTGTLTLTGTNTYSGGTTIERGRLDITTNANLGDSASKLTINNGTLHNSNDLVMNREIVLGAGNATLDVENGYLTLRAPISGSGGLVKTGSNILTLTGNNTYTGATIINKGSFKVESGTLASESVALARGTTFYMQNLESYAGEISGEGNIVKSGVEATTFTGTNTYTGTTTVTAGNLVVNGSIASSSLTTVQSGATLSGKGTVGDLYISSGGILAPGNSTGLLTVEGNLTLENAALITLEIASLTDFDRIAVNGGLTFGGILMIDFLEGFAFDTTTTFTLFTGGYTWISGTFDDIQFSAPDYEGSFDYETGLLTIAVIPEPSVYALLIVALSCTVLYRRLPAMRCRMA